MLAAALNVLRALLVTAGRPVLRRALALWTAIGIVATILFAGNGIHARDVARMFHGDVGVRFALGTMWIVLVTPVVSPAFDAAGTRTLRSLPVRRAVWVASLLALLLLVQAPCGVLFARADGPLGAIVEALLAVAIEAAIVAATRKPRFAVAAMAATGLVLADARPVLTAVPAAGLAAASVAAAWRFALDAAGRDVHLTRRAPAVIVLTVVHLLRMLRVARAEVAVAASSAAVGALALGLSLYNDPPQRPVARAIAVFAFPVTVCAAVLVGPVREAEDPLRSLARVTRTRWTTLVAAFALALAVPSSALAATAGALAGTFAHASVLPLSGAAGAAAVPIAGAIAAWARWHDRRTRRNPALFVVGVIVIAALATGVGVAW